MRTLSFCEEEIKDKVITGLRVSERRLVMMEKPQRREVFHVKAPLIPVLYVEVRATSC